MKGSFDPQRVHDPQVRTAAFALKSKIQRSPSSSLVSLRTIGSYGVISHVDHDITDDITRIGCEGVTLSLISQKKTTDSRISVIWNVQDRYRVQIYGCR